MTRFHLKNKLVLFANRTKTFFKFLIKFYQSFCYLQYIQFFAIKENLYENCLSKDGNIKNEYAVDVELNFELKEIYMKKQYKYLGNEGNFVTP